MPRQRSHHSRIAYDFPHDFSRRLELFREASRLSSAEMARRLGTSPENLRRWTDGTARPNAQHMMATLDLAAGLDLDHLLTQEGLGEGVEPGT